MINKNIISKISENKFYQFINKKVRFLNLIISIIPLTIGIASTFFFVDKVYIIISHINPVETTISEIILNRSIIDTKVSLFGKFETTGYFSKSRYSSRGMRRVLITTYYYKFFDLKSNSHIYAQTGIEPETFFQKFGFQSQKITGFLEKMPEEASKDAFENYYKKNYQFKSPMEILINNKDLKEISAFILPVINLNYKYEYFFDALIFLFGGVIFLWAGGYIVMVGWKKINKYC